MTPFQSEKNAAFAMRTLIKKAMKIQGASYESIWHSLTEAGVEVTNPAALKNKINRGRFSAIFFIQVLSVLNIKQIIINDGNAHLVLP